ncbi:MAG: preprotein translocase subunit YajC [Deltaproteobacteria bacterium]|nr:preprotein translocase subunit YajC [Deltaproteobacteria bacterium]
MGELVQSLVTQSGGGGAFVSMILPIGIMVVVMWLFMIRPERKKQQEHQDFLGSLKRGDEVVLNSGLIGTVQSVDERTLTIDLADKVRVRVLKMAVSGPSSRFLGAGTGSADKVPAAPAADKDKADKADKAKKAS